MTTTPIHRIQHSNSRSEGISPSDTTVNLCNRPLRRCNALARSSTSGSMHSSTVGMLSHLGLEISLSQLRLQNGRRTRETPPFTCKETRSAHCKGRGLRYIYPKPRGGATEGRGCHDRPSGHRARAARGGYGTGGCPRENSGSVDDHYGSAKGTNQETLKERAITLRRSVHGHGRRVISCVRLRLYFYTSPSHM